MTEEEIKRGKFEYENLIIIRDILKRLKNENVWIKHYFATLSEFEKLGLVQKQNELKNLTDENLAVAVFNPIAKNTKENKNIYVYMGNFVHDMITGDIVKSIDDDTKNFYTYKHYRNLETEDEIALDFEKAYYFEKNNLVYKTNNLDQEKFFSDLRTAYFSEMVGLEPKQLLKK